MGRSSARVEEGVGYGPGRVIMMGYSRVSESALRVRDKKKPNAYLMAGLLLLLGGPEVYYGTIISRVYPYFKYYMIHCDI